MGAISFIKRVQSENASLAFQELVGQAVYEHGKDKYNGTISTCSIGRCRRIFDKPSKNNLTLAYKFIEDHDNGEKRLADYIDLGISHYVIRKVTKVLPKSKTPVKFKPVFNIERDFDDKPVAQKETKKEAEETALNLTLKTGKEHYVRKSMKIVSGSADVSRFIISETQVAKKPSFKPNSKKVVVPIHEYIFYGWAAD